MICLPKVHVAFRLGVDICWQIGHGRGGITVEILWSVGALRFAGTGNGRFIVLAGGVDWAGLVVWCGGQFIVPAVPTSVDLGWKGTCRVRYCRSGNMMGYPVWFGV